MRHIILNLIVVSGGYRWPAKSKQYQDRFYINDGKGNYKQNKNALPKIESSGSCVVTSDYDFDGDLDLFNGGRVIGRNYPLAPQSYLLENRDGVCDGRIINIGNPDNEASIKELGELLVTRFQQHPLKSKFPPFAGFREIESRVYYGAGYQDIGRI